MAAMSKSTERRASGHVRWGLLLFAFLCTLGLVAQASAQAIFGRNKVVYSDREWWVLEDGWLHLYYYPEEEELARQTLAIAREAYDDFADYFDYEFDEPIPIILYGSHHDFKQTHVTPGFVPEGTAGFTEFVKGRIALRATGNYADLHHLVRHELVHAFMLHEMADIHNERGLYDYIGPPLWFIEGLAESVANDGQPDSDARMFVRDAVLHDGLVRIPELWTIQGSYLMYKEGESILDFLRLQFGDRVPAHLLDQWWRGDQFEEILKLELGLDYAELDERWSSYLKRRYYPEMLSQRSPGEFGTRLLSDSYYDSAPKLIELEDSGRATLVALSPRGGTVSLYEITLPEEGDAQMTRIVEGGRKAEYETLPLFRSRVDVHDKRLVAFVAKSGQSDAIYVWDLQERRRIDDFAFANLRQLSSPSFSPDGMRVVFSGLAEDGFSDLYIFDRQSRALRRLTADPYDDLHPEWHPREERLVFSSDRADPLGGDLALFEMDIASGGLKQLSSGRGKDMEPVWSASGDEIAFISDRTGVRNLYIYAPRTGASRQQTDITGGVYMPDWLGDDEVVASVFHRGNFHLYRFPLEQEGAGLLQSVEATERVRDPRAKPPLLDAPALPASEDTEARAYDVDMGLDIVSSVVAMDPDLPFGSGAAVGFSDILGDHEVLGHVSTVGDEFKIDDLNFGVSYTDRRSRLNRHYGVFRVNTLQYQNSLVPTRLETRTGGFIGGTYPLSTFRRIELSSTARYLKRESSFDFLDTPGETWLWSIFASYVHDNTLWAWTGPRRGNRYNLTVGQSFDLMGRGFDRQSLQIDARHYTDILGSVIVANRAVHRQSFGSDTQFFFVGGPNDLRGYKWFSFQGERLTLVNTEIRFPLVERLALRLPFAALDFPSIQGALFNDMANVDGRISDTGWIGSFGFSTYMTLIPPLALRVDWAKPHNFDVSVPWKVKTSLSFLF